MSYIARLFTLSLLALVVGGCSSMHKRGDVAAADVPRTTIRVENRSFNDVTIYVVRSSQRIRLGSVSGASTQTLPIPSNVIFGPTSLRFIAAPLASNQREITQEITVAPGDQVEMIIPP